MTSGPAPRGSGDKDGSYTARPSNEPPPERVTRNEDEEAVERTGGEHEVTEGGDARGPGDEGSGTAG